MTTLKDLHPAKCASLNATCIDAFVSLGYDEDYPTHLRLDSPWNWCSLDMTPIVDACIDDIVGDLKKRLEDVERRVSDLEQGIGRSDQSNWLETNEGSISYIKNKPPITDFTITRTDPGVGSELEDNHFLVVFN